MPASVCLPVCVCPHLFVPVCLLLSVSVCLPTCLCQSLPVSVCLPWSMSVRLPISVSACLPAPACLSLSVHVCVPVSVCLSLSACLPLSVCPCLPLSLSVCLPACLCLSVCQSRSVCLPVSLCPSLYHSLQHTECAFEFFYCEVRVPVCLCRPSQFKKFAYDDRSWKRIVDFFDFPLTFSFLSTPCTGTTFHRCLTVRQYQPLTHYTLSNTWITESVFPSLHLSSRWHMQLCFIRYVHVFITFVRWWYM